MSFTVRNIVSCFIVLFYLSVGIFLILAKTEFFTASLKQQKFVGWLFIIFSIYKGFMVYRKWSKQKQITNDEI